MKTLNLFLYFVTTPLTMMIAKQTQQPAWIAVSYFCWFVQFYYVFIDRPQWMKRN